MYRKAPPVNAAATARQPRVGGLLLAAGRGTRADSIDKLLADFRGLPVAQHALDALTGASLDTVVMVTGHRPARLESALSLQNVTVVHNRRHTQGMSTSLQAGVDALRGYDAIVIALADMPEVSSDVIDALIQAVRERPSASMHIPRYRDHPGNPVLITRTLYPAIARLHGDTGARVLRENAEVTVNLVDTDCPGILVDYDTEADFAALVGRDRS